MNPIPHNTETLALAKRLIWFEAPTQALQDPVRLRSYNFQFGRAADFAVLNRLYSAADLRLALQGAPPGIFDGRSYAYWSLMLNLPSCTTPQRQFRDLASQPGDPHEHPRRQ